MIRKRVGVLALVLVLALFPALVVPAPASAATEAGDCQDEPVPQMPGAGLSGFLDPGPDVPPAPGNAFAVGGGTSVYEQYGYPPAWATYDLGCGGDWVRDPGARMDTMIANWVQGGATVIVAATNSLHNLVSPPTFLGALDPLVENGTAAIAGSLYGPWLPISLVIVAITLLAMSMRMALPSAVSMAAWALLVMTIGSAVIAYPTRFSGLADATVTETVATIDETMVSTGSLNSGNSGIARGSLLVDSVLYQQWLRGTLGDPTSDVAREHGPGLFDATHYTYAEARTIGDDPQAGKAITERKQNAFHDIAAEIEEDDPAAYAQLRGQGSSRIGAAAISVVIALLSCPFMLVSDLLIIAGLLIIRLAVVFFPAIAVVGMHRGTAGVVRGALSTVGAALINSIVFAVGAGLNALALRILFTESGLPGMVATILAGVITVTLWVALKPFRKLTALVPGNSSPLTDAAGAPGAIGRGARRLIGKGAGIYLTGKIAGNSAADEISEDWDERERTTRPEEWSRPADAPAPAPATAPAPAGGGGGIVVAPPAAVAPTPPRSLPVAYAAPERPALPVGSVRESAPVEPTDILPPDAPLPRNVYRADPVYGDNGKLIHRIWNPTTREYEIVKREDSESE